MVSSQSVFMFHLPKYFANVLVECTAIWRETKIPQLKPLTVLVHLSGTEQQLCFYYCNQMSKSEFIFDDWEYNKRQSNLMASALCFGGPNVLKHMIQSWSRFIQSKWSHGDWRFRTCACITGHHKPICQSQPADELLHWKPKQAKLESNTLIWFAAVQQALKYVLSWELSLIHQLLPNSSRCLLVLIIRRGFWQVRRTNRCEILNIKI